MTEQEFEKVLSIFTKEEQEAIRLCRKELTEKGITKEPLRTEMACEFADVLLNSRRKKR